MTPELISLALPQGWAWLIVVLWLASACLFLYLTGKAEWDDFAAWQRASDFEEATRREAALAALERMWQEVPR